MQHKMMTKPAFHFITRLPALCCCLCFFMTLSAQITRVEPPNWWIGMQDNTLQLLVQGPEIGQLTPVINYPGVRIEKIHRADSRNYLFIDLSIAADTKPGEVSIAFKRGNATLFQHNYPLLARKQKPEAYEGFNPSDVIYLITPDRFANGDANNDIVPSLAEKKIDRLKGFTRHGGDIQGIIDHLDYLAEMGFTAIWPSPLLENDMPDWSYHGYAITDYYRVDPRFGTLDTYKALAEKARGKGMKLIFDGVVNHCGSNHWWMKDLPFKDWLNFPEKMQVTNHRRTVNQDPYAAKIDQELMVSGWFVPTMPDLNQRNPFFAYYLIQNSIWWIETLQLGGIRQDTYPYPDKDFLTAWSCRIMAEYPNFSLVGEEWSFNPLIAAYWQQGKVNHDGYVSCLKSPMDFPMQRTLTLALTEPESWDQGLVKLYEGLANDFAYANPNHLMTLGDNHDMDRLFTQLKEDVSLTKIALAYLLTMRGIPQIYYGTEVLLGNTGFPGDHGVIRTDFPGGWAGDKVNGFTGAGLSKDQQDVQLFLKKLLNWRKGSLAVQQGKTMHFGPIAGVYVYFRYTPSQKIMVIINKNEQPTTLDTGRFAEMLSGHVEGTDILTGERKAIAQSLNLNPRSALILEIR
ncbi:MAG: glycoside hydrolase family 13 protein [Saprospiraceae bacterium]|nr:glycoside hydrolase family 13 protein [Saprospiraceae bacterium]